MFGYEIKTFPVPEHNNCLIIHLDTLKMQVLEMLFFHKIFCTGIKDN